MAEQCHKDLQLLRVWQTTSQILFSNIHYDIESYEINKEHFILLELLYNKGPHPVQRISEILSIPSGSITYVVDKLGKKGLVKRQPNPNDKRVCDVTLTEEGKQLFDEVFPKHVATISENLSFITDEEKDLLIGLLKRIEVGAQSLDKYK